MWCKTLPILNGICDGSLFAQMPFLSVTPDIKGKLRLRQFFKQLAVPCLRTNFRRRQVRPFFVIPRKTKSHWNDVHFALVIKLVALYSQPFTKPVTGWVIKGNARLINAHPRRLPANQNLCRVRKPNNRSRAMRGFGRRKSHCANLARLYLCVKVGKRTHCAKL